ncbi:MAG: flagellar hook capping FlgD N-terminal domain-containing protein [Tumebacillaceae bacterium]
MTYTYSIDPSNMYDPNKSKAPAKKEMDRDAFLKILITQLQNQDPTQPMQDREFISQMAQFSSLEQMSKVSQTNSMMLGAQLIGNTVSYRGEDNELLTGDVTGVEKSGGLVYVLIGDKKIDLNSVESINQKQ